MDTKRKPERKLKSNQGQPWIKVADAAEQLGVPLTRCYELIQRGELPAVRIGERYVSVGAVWTSTRGAASTQSRRDKRTAAPDKQPVNTRREQSY